MTAYDLPAVIDLYCEAHKHSWAKGLKIKKAGLEVLLEYEVRGQTTTQHWISDDVKSGFEITYDSLTFTKPVFYVNHFINMGNGLRSHRMFKTLKEVAINHDCYCVIFSPLYNGLDGGSFAKMLFRAGYRKVDNVYILYLGAE